MTYQNPHTALFDLWIKKIQGLDKYKSTFVNTSHDDFVADFSSSIFTNINKYMMSGYKDDRECEDCSVAPAQNGCHGLGEERPVLLQRALKRVWPDISRPITLKEIVVAYLEEHKTTKYALKCEMCHKAEKKRKIYVEDIDA
jgi:hypothetical protein